MFLTGAKSKNEMIKQVDKYKMSIFSFPDIKWVSTNIKYVNLKTINHNRNIHCILTLIIACIDICVNLTIVGIWPAFLNK